MTSPSDYASPQDSKPTTAEFDALNSIILALMPLAEDARRRVLASVSVFLRVPGNDPAIAPGPAGGWRSVEVSPSDAGARFSEDRAPSPKEFLFEKHPTTDVERIACLAYYLTHYRDTPHFKTLDLSTLNTEAAQLKFSNAANAAENATKKGLLVPASKGAKQLSALGERYVQALPDRDAAREAIADAKPRRRSRRSRSLGDDDLDGE